MFAYCLLLRFGLAKSFFSLVKSRREMKAKKEKKQSYIGRE